LRDSLDDLPIRAATASVDASLDFAAAFLEFDAVAAHAEMAYPARRNEKQ
jgi:hypothetical protein